jgi:hypothetical protein
LRELQVGRERNPEHVDHEAQDAAEAGILAQERDELGDVELVHQLGARTGDLVAGEEEKKPAFALPDFAPWCCRFRILRCPCCGLFCTARDDGPGAEFGGIGGEGAKTAGEIG